MRLLFDPIEETPLVGGTNFQKLLEEPKVILVSHKRTQVLQVN